MNPCEALLFVLVMIRNARLRLIGVGRPNRMRMLWRGSYRLRDFIGVWSLCMGLRMLMLKGRLERRIELKLRNVLVCIRGSVKLYRVVSVSEAIVVLWVVIHILAVVMGLVELSVCLMIHERCVRVIMRMRLAGKWLSLESDVSTAMGDRLVLEVRRLEDNALVVAIAMAFALDAILAHRTLFAAFDATLATGEASGLGPFARQLCFQGSFGSRSVGALGVGGRIIVAVLLELDA